MIQTYRMERDAWKRAFENVKVENQLFQTNMEQRFNNLEHSIDAERKGWKREVRKAKAPGFGFFVGPAVPFRGGDIEIVGGFGLVWKVW